MTVLQIKQTIGQLKASIDSARKVMEKERFLEYSTNMYQCIEEWETILTQ